MIIASQTSLSPDKMLALRDDYINFANYLLTGDIEGSDWQNLDEANNYIVMPDYEFYQQVYDKQDQQYFTTLDNLFNQFMTSYDEVREDFDEDAREQIDEFRRDFRETRERYSTSSDEETIAIEVIDDETNETGSEEVDFELMQSYMVDTIQQDCWRILDLISISEAENA